MQGKQVWKSGDQEIWLRELAGGSKAVGITIEAQQPQTLLSNGRTSA